MSSRHPQDSPARNRAHRHVPQPNSSAALLTPSFPTPSRSGSSILIDFRLEGSLMEENRRGADKQSRFRIKMLFRAFQAKSPVRSVKPAVRGGTTPPPTQSPSWSTRIALILVLVLAATLVLALALAAVVAPLGSLIVLLAFAIILGFAILVTLLLLAFAILFISAVALANVRPHALF